MLLGYQLLYMYMYIYLLPLTSFLYPNTHLHTHHTDIHTHTYTATVDVLISHMIWKKCTFCRCGSFEKSQRKEKENEKKNWLSYMRLCDLCTFTGASTALPVPPSLYALSYSLHVKNFLICSSVTKLSPSGTIILLLSHQHMINFFRLAPYTLNRI